MIIDYHKKFLKIFDKLPEKIKDKFYQRLRLFSQEPFHPLLNNHPVDSAYPGWRSINITGDYRALYELKADNLIEFMNIGTHSELYG
jgi:addiction module RelE/StbE family toxin